MDMYTGDFYSRLYVRTMNGFKDGLSEVIQDTHININTLTMDNVGKNNMLWEIVEKKKLFNCHAYCSGEKGTLENKHRILRRVIPKGISLDNYSKKDILILNNFVDNYYSKMFNKI